LFDIHVHYFPLVSLLVTELCTLNLALAFFAHTSFQLSRLCYSWFAFHVFSFSKLFLFLLCTHAVLRLHTFVILMFVCFVSYKSLHLYTFVIYFHSNSLRLIIQLTFPLLEFSQVIILLYPAITQFRFTLFISFYFSNIFIRPFQVPFLYSLNLLSAIYVLSPLAIYSSLCLPFTPISISFSAILKLVLHKVIYF
jgi:hypothetical protein